MESAAGREAGERAVRAIAVRDTLDIASFPGHGNEAIYSGLPESTGACVHASSLATPLHPPTTNKHDKISCSTCIMATLKRTNERSCINALFLNPLRLMILNAKKMTTSDFFGLSE